MGKQGQIAGIPPERKILIDRQHALEGLDGGGWTADRLYRLCHLLHCQPEELAYRYFIPGAAMNKWIKKNHIPPYVTLHFVGLERFLFAAAQSAKMRKK